MASSLLTALVRASEDTSLASHEQLAVALRELSAEEPSTEAIELLAQHRRTVTAVGLTREALEVLDGWRMTLANSDAHLDAVALGYAVDADTEGGLLRMQRRDLGEGEMVAMRVAALGRSRNLQQAIDLAEANDWLLEEPAAIEAVGFAVSALLARHEFERAAEIIARWRTSTWRGDPTIEPVLLRLETKAASYQDRFHVAVRTAERAVELYATANLPLARNYAEAEYVTVLARAGFVDEASELMRRWPEHPAPGLLLAYRRLARAEAALIDGNSGKAGADAAAAAAYFAEVGHAPLHAEAAFLELLGSEPGACRSALERFRKAVRRCPAARHSKRMAVLDAMCAHGYQSLDEVVLIETTRYTEEQLPLFRAWVPRPTAIESGLFWNRVRNTFYVLGTGPHRLDRQPILKKVLEAILSSPGFCLALPELFEQVWGAAYRPVRHENKVNVTLHRLRRWLQQHVPGKPQLLLTSSGEVCVPPEFEVCVLSLQKERPQVSE